jgi:hypothetical protein
MLLDEDRIYKVSFVLKDCSIMGNEGWGKTPKFPENCNMYE